MWSKDFWLSIKGGVTRPHRWKVQSQMLKIGLRFRTVWDFEFLFLPNGLLNFGKTSQNFSNKNIDGGRHHYAFFKFIKDYRLPRKQKQQKHNSSKYCRFQFHISMFVCFLWCKFFSENLKNAQWCLPLSIFSVEKFWKVFPKFNEPFGRNRKSKSQTMQKRKPIFNIWECTS